MVLKCDCWRRLLRVPWTARRSNQSVLKEINPEYSLEGLMLKLKLHTLATWFKGLTHWKRPWCWEKLKAGGEGDNRGWDGWMASATRWTWVWASSRSWWTGRLACCSLFKLNIKDPLRKLPDIQGLKIFYLCKLLENTLHQNKWTNQKKKIWTPGNRSTNTGFSKGNPLDNGEGKFRSDMLKNVSFAPYWAC